MAETVRGLKNSATIRRINCTPSAFLDSLHRRWWQFNYPCASLCCAWPSRAEADGAAHPCLHSGRRRRRGSKRRAWTPSLAVWLGWMQTSGRSHQRQTTLHRPLHQARYGQAEVSSSGTGAIRTPILRGQQPVERRKRTVWKPARQNVTAQIQPIRMVGKDHGCLV